jgi:hypothetical protein
MGHCGGDAARDQADDHQQKANCPTHKYTSLAKGRHRRHYEQFLEAIGKTRQTISRDPVIVKIGAVTLSIAAGLPYNSRRFYQSNSSQSEKQWLLRYAGT